MFYITSSRIFPAVFFLCASLLHSCSLGSEQEQCRYGAPVAIFSEQLPGVSSHHFNRKGQEGIEEVVFEDGTELTLFQSGCNAIRQEFRFKPAYIGDGDPNWFLLAADQFRFIAGLDPGLAPFAQYAIAISDLAGRSALGEPTTVFGGQELTVDKVGAGENLLLVVTLEEQETD